MPEKESNPWAEAWLQASPPAPAKRPRKPYLIQNLVIEAGIIRARLHDGRSARPCNISIELPIANLATWRVWLFHRGLPPFALGLLFARHYTPRLAEAFAASAIELKADVSTMNVRCTCLESQACRHLYPLWIRVGQEIERKPLLWLDLMGLDGKSTYAIFDQWLKPRDTNAPATIDDREADAAGFWGSDAPLPEMPVEPIPDDPCWLLKRMSIPPFWPDHQGLGPPLEKTYQAAARGNANGG